MTNDEAIYTLLNAEWLGSNEDKERIEEAVDIAIKALCLSNDTTTQKNDK